MIKKYLFIPVFSVLILASPAYGFSFKSFKEKVTEAFTETGDFFNSLGQDIKETYKEHAKPHVDKMYEKAKQKSEKLWNKTKSYYKSFQDSDHSNTSPVKFYIKDVNGTVDVIDRSNSFMGPLSIPGQLETGYSLVTNNESGAFFTVGWDSSVSVLLNESSNLSLNKANIIYKNREQSNVNNHCSMPHYNLAFYLKKGQIILDFSKVFGSVYAEIYTPAGVFTYIDDSFSFKALPVSSMKMHIESEANGKRIILMLLDK